jgi:hypothetical protein
MKKNMKFLIGAIVLYVLSTGVSYGVFGYLNKSTVISGTESLTTTPSVSGFKKPIDTAPKTESCPLNGQMFSKAKRTAWEQRRPLGVMIENHEEARPQSGLSNADIIYEAVAEGGITRFLSIYYCDTAEMVGPVRSARTYFVDMISEYADFPLYAHVGGANTPGPANALGQIDDYGWSGYNDLNQFSIGFPTYWRDYERMGRPVATEHTMYSTPDKLWAIAMKRGLTNVDEKGVSWDKNFVPWKFKDDGKITTPEVSTAVFDFWPNYDKYGVKWILDTVNNDYKRENGGVPFTDKNTDEQLTAKNVVFMFMTEENADDGYENNAHLLYGTKGKGKMILLQDGVKVEGQWQKLTRTARTKYTDLSGKEIQFNKGKIWIEIVPAGTAITFN